MWALPTEPFPSPGYLISYFPRNAQFQHLCSSQVLLSSPLTLTDKRCAVALVSARTIHREKEVASLPSSLQLQEAVKNLRGACRRQRQMSRDVGLCFLIVGLKKCPWILRASFLTPRADISADVSFPLSLAPTEPKASLAPTIYGAPAMCQTLYRHHTFTSHNSSLTSGRCMLAWESPN